jgi:hypothetical protein
MKQLALSALAILSTASIPQVLAADYGALPDFRPSYPDQWAPEEGDPLSFDVGVRYWYSIGKQDHSVGTYTETMETRTHSGEAYARINDASTNSFLEAFGGYGVAHDGSYSTNGGASVTLPAARLGYAGLDFGGHRPRQFPHIGHCGRFWRWRICPLRRRR